MWFPRANSSGDLSCEVKKSQEQLAALGTVSTKEAVQNIFNSTHCYDLMQNSTKVVVFETQIPFQLAFYALVEHDIEIAPLWDPEKKAFAALMTMSDFIQALRIYRNRGISVTDLANRTIMDMLHSQIAPLRYQDFETIDAEDSVFQLCRILQTRGRDFIPVIDPDEGNLVAILGYLDLVNLLNTAAQQFPHLFSQTIEETGLGTYRVVTAPQHALLADVLNILEERGISSIPVVDPSEKVLGLYYKADTTFLTRAPDPGAVMSSLASLTVGEAVSLQQQQQQSGESLATSQGMMCTCISRSLISEVLQVMMNARSARVVITDETGKCLAIASIRDIVWYYLS